MLALYVFGIFVTSTAGYTMCPMHVECIPGCVGLDERGCKTCACGPQMFVFGAGKYGMPGMSGGGASFHPGSLGGGSSFGSIQGESHHEKPLKECPGTMLCMMTCKGHYSLSSKVGHDGCRACTCPKEQPMHLVVETKPSPKPPTHPDCTGTKLCMLTCKGEAILGQHGKDGCQTCACVPEHHLVPVPEHKEECHATVLCMSSCKHGYNLGATSGSCQECTCKPEPTPAPTPAPARLECPKTLECMLSCKDGYQLGSAGPDGCPHCSCLAPPREIILVKEVTCSKALSCKSGCTVGYKCDDNGCPVCECIKPEVVGIMTITEVYTKKEVTCGASFSCSKSCHGTMGYKCGDDGCPICECLSQVHTVTNTKPIVVQPKPQTTNTAVSTVVTHCHVTMNCMTSCEHGYTLGNTGKDGCPSCTCIQPQITECHTGCEHKPAMTIHTCDKALTCMASCTDGYELGRTGSDGCPSCTCKQPACSTGCTETHHEVIEIPITASMVGGSSGGISGSSGGAMVSGGGSGPFSAGGSGGGMTGGGMTGGGDQCPPLPPNCHPYCIKYDVAHCRKCECTSTGTGAYRG